MSVRVVAALIGLALCIAGCSSSGSDSSPSTQDTYYAQPSDLFTDEPSISYPPITDEPVPEDTEPPVEDSEPTTPAGIPDVQAGAPARCTFALEALESAGADTLEPDSKPVLKALTSCRNVEQWVGGLYAVPGALGYASASELDDETLTSDLQVLCAGGPRTPTCKDASKRGLLD